MMYSFVLIAYNEDHNIEACIASITKLVNLGEDYEVIVVDDGSTDNTVNIVNTLSESNRHVRLVSDGKNHGRGYGRHKGVQASMGTYVIMVDSDIVLPKHWLKRCLAEIEKNDVVGGIAVPDGDVAYIYRKLQMKPKTILGSTAITGNNGMYKRSIFSRVVFDSSLRDGEDVDFGHKAKQAGLKLKTIDNLTVEHQENKSFEKSLQWLYQSGVGATRQLIRFKEIRLPDIAFLGTLFCFLLACYSLLATGSASLFALPAGLILIASHMHIKSKFHLLSKGFIIYLNALAIDSLLLISYCIGRIWGVPVALRRAMQR